MFFHIIPHALAAETVKLNDPLNLPNGSIVDLAVRINTALLGLVGFMALIMFIYAGVTMLTAGGDAKKVQKARDTMMYAALGLVVIFSSYAILNFVVSVLTSTAK